MELVKVSLNGILSSIVIATGILLTLGLTPAICQSKETSANGGVTAGTADSNPDGPDYADQVFQLQSSAWKASQMPLKVWISDGKGVPGYRDQYRQIFIDALNTWKKAMDGKVSWVPCNSRDDASFVCVWVGSIEDVEQHGPTFGEFGNTSIGQLGLGADAQNDQAEIFMTTRGKSECLADDVMRGLCLHEIGHALGCKGHSPNRHDVMFPSVNKLNREELSARDIATMAKIYANNARVKQDTAK
jgi:predicted Zn-dependent protease